MGGIVLINGLFLLGSQSIHFDLFLQDNEAYLLINEQFFNLTNGEIIIINNSDKIPIIQQHDLQSFLSILLMK